MSTRGGRRARACSASRPRARCARTASPSRSTSSTRSAPPWAASPGRSRIYRTSYRRDDYVRLARRAIDEWHAARPGAAAAKRPARVRRGRRPSTRRRWSAAASSTSWLEPRRGRAAVPRGALPGGRCCTTHDGRRGPGRRRAAAAARRGSTCAQGTRIADPRAAGGRRRRGRARARGWRACSTCRCRPGSSRWRTSRGSPTRGRRWSTTARARRHASGTGWCRPGVGYKLGAGRRPAGPVRPRAARPPGARRSCWPCLSAHVRRGVPRPRSRRPLHSEACLYTMTPDGDFILDEIDGVVVCGGDSGHAFKFGPLLGRLCADLAQGAPAAARVPTASAPTASRRPVT